MPVRHVVVFTWNDDVPTEHAADVSAALAELPAAISQITSYSYGPDLGLVPGNGSYAVVAEFDDEAGFLAYREHPAHQDFVERFIVGRTASRIAAQYEI